ncbi:MAG: lactate utilization protein, partial [Nitrospirae bacterium]|nr:lactate utilization protein [Nitrospirota bacterium]
MNFEEIIAIREAFRNVKKRQAENMPPDLNEKFKRLRVVREISVGNNDLIKKAVERIEANGIKVLMAKSGDEAIRIILERLKDEKVIVKSKSNVTKEIRLTEELESKGIKVVETDIGDRILQVLKEKPSHPTGPISHLPARRISQQLSKIYGVQINERPEDIVEFVRNEVRENIKRSNIGITGANAITAEEGSIVLAHNEGNISEVIRKEKHIVVTAIDKVYPSVEEALNMLKVITYNATGSLIPSFVEIISSVSKTADVEKKFFKGVHSPAEIILILLDNNRTEIMEKGFKELLFCIDCGNCLLYCPMYNTVGNYFGEEKYLGGKGLVLQSLTKEEVNKKLEFCLTCGKCKKNCPLSIDIPSIIRNVRSKNLSHEAYTFLKSHLMWLYYVLRLKVWSNLK